MAGPDIKNQNSLSVVIFSHSSFLGGGERSLLELTRQLTANHNMRCSVILPSSGPLKDKLEETGASTLVLDYTWWCESTLLGQDVMAARINDGMLSILSHLEELNKLDPDVIVTNTMVIPWGALVAYFLNKPHVWFIREFGELDHDLKFPFPFFKVMELIRSSSSQILVNSKAVATRLFGKEYADNIHVIYPPVNVPANTKIDNRIKYYSRASSLKLIIVGNICAAKGQQDAIQAVRYLIKNKQDVELIVMGHADQSYLKELKAIVKSGKLESSIHFLEFNPDPYGVINQADLTLVCSRNEAFGRVIIETFMLKKPVIAAKSGGVPETVREGLNGLLYEAGDIQQLASKIEYFLADREKIREYGENGYNFALANFSKEKCGEEFARVLESLKYVPNTSTEPFIRFVLQTNLSFSAYLANLLKDKDSGPPSRENRLKPGIVFQLQNKYQARVEKLLPPGSRRRALYELELSAILVILNEGWKSFGRKSGARMRQYGANLINSLIPQKGRTAIGYYWNKIYFGGYKYKCPYCHSNLRKLFPYGASFPVLEEKQIIGGGVRENGRCPVCSSIDRERLLVLWLKNESDLFSRPTKLLHVAPEAGLQRILEKQENIDYLTADLYSTSVMLKMDVTDIHYPDDFFDAIICNHVLEHIVDDSKALSELYRVLKPGGWAVLQVPISLSLEETFEDASIDTPAMREKAFGQNDHVRIYSRDYPERLKAVGFDTAIFDWTAQCKAYGGTHNRFGLNKKEKLYWVRK
jgi:glycosyltransferase involved in cell wall biosynthesis